MNVQPHLLELAELRSYFEIPPPEGEQDEKYTFAKLIIGGEVLYGSNWKKTKPGAASKHVGLNDDMKEFIEELAMETHVEGKGFFWGQVPKHAETDAILTAYDKGLTAQHKTGVLITDRPVCPFCRRADGLPRLLGLLGIESLMIYDPENPQGFQVRPSGNV